MQHEPLILANKKGWLGPAVVPPLVAAKKLSLIQQEWVRRRIKLHLLWLALRQYKSWRKAWKVLKQLQAFKEKMYGADGKRKLVYRNGRYWVSMYLPPFPSENFDRYILTEFNRILPHGGAVNHLQQLNFAITNHCPMRCEHCFEWDNLNKHETFTRDELHSMLQQFQQEGLGQISLTGGEPMIRYNDMLQLIKTGSRTTEWWMLTSGFGMNLKKAQALKKAGLSGIVVSIDHYKGEQHDIFRNYWGAFIQAVSAVRYARKAGLLAAVSVCITRQHGNEPFLENYMRHAAAWGADFVQLLEARAAGHYKDQHVELHAKQLSLLGDFYLRMNHDAACRHAVPIVYHGYHQRLVGCLMGGNRSCYVDSAGMVQSCPFCHSHDFNVKAWLQQPLAEREKVSACPIFH